MDELNVKVGDELLLSSGYGYSSRERIVTVIKVTPAGRIKVNGMDCTFDKYGREMGTKSIWAARSYLKIPTKEDMERVDNNNTIRKAIIIINKLEKNLTLAQARKIIDFFDGEVDGL